MDEDRADRLGGGGTGVERCEAETMSVGAVFTRQADFDEDTAEVHALWHEYLMWVNPQLEEQYGISFPIDEILEENLVKLSRFALPNGRLLLASDAEGGRHRVSAVHCAACG